MSQTQKLLKMQRAVALDANRHRRDGRNSGDAGFTMPTPGSFNPPNASTPANPFVTFVAPSTGSAAKLTIADTQENKQTPSGTVYERDYQHRIAQMAASDNTTPTTPNANKYIQRRRNAGM